MVMEFWRWFPLKKTWQPFFSGKKQEILCISTFFKDLFRNYYKDILKTKMGTAPEKKKFVRPFFLGVGLVYFLE